MAGPKFRSGAVPQEHRWSEAEIIADVRQPPAPTPAVPHRESRWEHLWRPEKGSEHRYFWLPAVDAAAIGCSLPSSARRSKNCGLPN